MKNEQHQYKAAIYARYSSSGQREESIEGQVRECKAFAERNNIIIVKIYADKATSGTSTEKRLQFQQMMRDSEKGIFDAVICWKIDRFARNRYDSAMNKYKLKRNGIRLAVGQIGITAARAYDHCRSFNAVLVLLGVFEKEG